jgi:hypothetical protein
MPFPAIHVEVFGGGKNMSGELTELFFRLKHNLKAYIIVFFDKES